jgi:hypothetical protein
LAIPFTATQSIRHLFAVGGREYTCEVKGGKYIRVLPAVHQFCFNIVKSFVNGFIYSIDFGFV